jgi:hypothetical protein
MATRNTKPRATGEKPVADNKSEGRSNSSDRSTRTQATPAKSQTKTSPAKTPPVKASPAKKRDYSESGSSYSESGSYTSSEEEKSTKPTKSSSGHSRGKSASGAAPKLSTEKSSTEKSTKTNIRAPKFNPINAVADKYEAAGWVLAFPPKNAISDMIAHKNNSIHFVRVVPSENCSQPLYCGSAKNDFIQNAMSNSVIPIFAHVSVVTKNIDGVNTPVPQISLENINLNTRVIIARGVAGSS